MVEELFYYMLTTQLQYIYYILKQMDRVPILMEYLFLIQLTTQLLSIPHPYHNHQEYYLVSLLSHHIIFIKPILDVQVHLSLNYHTINQEQVNYVISNSMPQCDYLYLIYQDHDNLFYRVFFQNMNPKVLMFIYSNYLLFQDFYIIHPTIIQVLEFPDPINNNKYYVLHY